MKSARARLDPLLFCAPLLVGCASPSADSAPPGALESHGHPLRAESSEVRIYSRLDLDFARLVEVAQATRTRMRAWLTPDAAEPAEPVVVYLCGEDSELRALEARLDLPPARYPRLFAHQKEGGYYHADRAVLLVVDGARDLEWLLVHEVAHSVFRDVARAHPVALNEGLAEIVPSWILHARAERPERSRAQHGEYTRQIARELAKGGGHPSLHGFFTMSSREFQADRWRNFALAWSLAKLLVESDDPRVAGRVPRLVAELGRRADVWADFRAVYDARHVEVLWHRLLASAR